MHIASSIKKKKIHMHATIEQHGGHLRVGQMPAVPQKDQRWLIILMHKVFERDRRPQPLALKMLLEQVHVRVGVVQDFHCCVGDDARVGLQLYGMQADGGNKLRSLDGVNGIPTGGGGRGLHRPNKKGGARKTRQGKARRLVPELDPRTEPLETNRRTQETGRLRTIVRREAQTCTSIRQKAARSPPSLALTLKASE